MGVVTYSSIDGEIISENRNGTRTDYVLNPLGSTVGLLNSSQTFIGKIVYWPYGEQVGSQFSGTQSMLYVGGRGCRQDGSSTRVHMRAREIDLPIGSWLSKDPWWPEYSATAYVYADDSPAGMIDPAGLQAYGRQAPVFDPTGWGFGHATDPDCLSYACNVKVGGPAQPKPGQPWSPPHGLPPSTYCGMLKFDLEHYRGWSEPTPGGKCPAGMHRVALYVDPRSGIFHVARQDRDGSWSQKQGREYPPSPCGSHPYWAAQHLPGYHGRPGLPDHPGVRWSGYSVFCGILCAPN